MSSSGRQPQQSAPAQPANRDMTRREFYEKALAANSDWTRFADPKAFGALVFLGLGLADLVGRADALVHAHRLKADEGDVATFAFWTAAILAAVAVFAVAHAVFPRVKPKTQSLFFFGAVASYDTVDEYRTEVEKLDARALEDQISSQVWEVSRVAAAKHRAAKWAFYCVLAFLAAWAVARVALSLAT